MNLPPYLHEAHDGVSISIKAQPRARRTEIAGLHGGELKIRVAAPPVDSAANEALLEFLSDRLGCPRRDVVLARGATSSHKQFVVSGLTVAWVAERLAVS